MRTLVWFRRDLRVEDNAALFHAAQESGKDGVIGLFVIPPQQWQEHDEAVCKVKFWLDNLVELSAELAKLRIPLRIETTDCFSGIPETIVKFAKRHKCSAVYVNREYEVNELKRDHEVASACEQAEIAVRRFHDRVIVPPREIATKEGKFYSVFTPYRRVWDSKAPEFIKTYPKPRKQPSLDLKPSKISSRIPGFDFSEVRDELWKPGETEALHRLSRFGDKIASYNEARDIPSIAGTSSLAA